MKQQYILVLMFQNSLILETPIAQLGRGCRIILQKKILIGTFNIQ